MKYDLNSNEAQLIIDELANAIRARKQAQPDYAMQLQIVRDKILRTGDKRRKK